MTDTPDISAAHEIAYLKQNSLPEVVLKIIEHKILNHEIGPGERINEKKLSEEFGVSRIPIREACRKLEQEGLLEIKVNRGMFVRELDVSAVLNIYDIRIALDDLAGRLVCERITDQEISQLQELVDRMEEVTVLGDINNFYPLNVDFHEMIYKCTRNDRLAKMYRALGRELRLFRSQAALSANNPVNDDLEFIRASNKEHQAIVDGLRMRDASSTCGLIKAHIITNRDRNVPSAADEGRRVNDDIASS